MKKGLRTYAKIIVSTLDKFLAIQDLQEKELNYIREALEMGIEVIDSKLASFEAAAEAAGNSDKVNKRLGI